MNKKKREKIVCLYSLASNLQEKQQDDRQRIIFLKIKTFSRATQIQNHSFFPVSIIAVLRFLFSDELVEKHDNKDAANEKYCGCNNRGIFGNEFHC
ncbi:hypothetical protein OO006_13055 [Prosthecochloris sp. SCSIO W1101]|uniref:hypothetical protein n=1 Tax=Prosthecochloris sp. SCSIO W1101 TaxID=2992242 RepID=UPI00223E7F84|nr:hypothetical protein [Prosthecochloris sp. SCSIO W1101]UZJ41251.1 hypothetical protein OO006_13055 [Prosthecochloris sp. SCSIO W1101]